MLEFDNSWLTSERNSVIASLYKFWTWTNSLLPREKNRHHSTKWLGGNFELIVSYCIDCEFCTNTYIVDRTSSWLQVCVHVYRVSYRSRYNRKKDNFEIKMPDKIRFRNDRFWKCTEWFIVVATYNWNGIFQIKVPSDSRKNYSSPWRVIKLEYFACYR